MEQAQGETRAGSVSSSVRLPRLRPGSPPQAARALRSGVRSRRGFRKGREAGGALRSEFWGEEGSPWTLPGSVRSQALEPPPPPHPPLPQTLPSPRRSAASPPGTQGILLRGAARVAGGNGRASVKARCGDPPWCAQKGRWPPARRPGEWPQHGPPPPPHTGPGGQSGDVPERPPCGEAGVPPSRQPWGTGPVTRLPGPRPAEPAVRPHGLHALCSAVRGPGELPASRPAATPAPRALCAPPSFRAALPVSSEGTGQRPPGPGGLTRQESRACRAHAAPAALPRLRFLPGHRPGLGVWCEQRENTQCRGPRPGHVHSPFLLGPAPPQGPR